MELVIVAKALADESRLRILRLIMERELCVCQVIEAIRLAPSTVSKHLLVLKQAGLIDSRKCGRWIHYRLASAKRRAAADGLAFVRNGLRADKQVAGDLIRLKKILGTDPSLLCRRRATR